MSWGCVHDVRSMLLYCIQVVHAVCPLMHPEMYGICTLSANGLYRVCTEFVPSLYGGRTLWLLGCFNLGTFLFFVFLFAKHLFFLRRGFNFNASFRIFFWNGHGEVPIPIYHLSGSLWLVGKCFCTDWVQNGSVLLQRQLYLIVIFAFPWIPEAPLWERVCGKSV